MTRLTVYRHFRDQDELFDACRRHWYVQNPLPDTAAWRCIPALEDRARRAFTELYAWFRVRGDALCPIYRDMASMPLTAQVDVRAQWAAVADALLAGVAVAPGARRSLRAAAGHLVGS